MHAPSPALVMSDVQREMTRFKPLLLTADGLASTDVACEIGVSPSSVVAWRSRFAEEGLARLGRIRPPMLTNYRAAHLHRCGCPCRCGQSSTQLGRPRCRLPDQSSGLVARFGLLDASGEVTAARFRVPDRDLWRSASCPRSKGQPPCVVSPHGANGGNSGQIPLQTPLDPGKVELPP